MVWNYMLIGLATGNRLILYDGSPFHPDLRTYLKFINDQRCGVQWTFFSFFDALTRKSRDFWHKPAIPR